MKLSEELKMLRLRMCISHDKLSEALKEKYGIVVSRESLIRYEKSDEACSKMKAETLCALAKFYDVSVDFLLGLSGYHDPAMPNLTVAELGLSEQAVMSMISQNSIVPGINLLAKSGNLKFLVDALARYYYACEADYVVEKVKERCIYNNKGVRPTNEQLAKEIGGLSLRNKLSTQTACDLLTLADRYKGAEKRGTYIDSEADRVFLNQLRMSDIYELKIYKHIRGIIADLEKQAEKRIFALSAFEDKSDGE